MKTVPQSKIEHADTRTHAHHTHLHTNRTAPSLLTPPHHPSKHLTACIHAAYSLSRSPLFKDEHAARKKEETMKVKKEIKKAEVRVQTSERRCADLWVAAGGKLINFLSAYHLTSH
jgi:hypothetical protein